MIVYLDFQDGACWENVSGFVRDNCTITHRASSDEYKYAVNLFDFTLTYDQSLMTRLHTKLDYVLVRVMEDDNTTYAFVGRFIPCIDTEYNGILNTQMVTLAASDYTSMLDIDMDEFITENMFILNSADETHSLVHLLFTHLGLSHSLIDPGVSILDTVAAAVSDEDSNALSFISTLMYEYGWVPNWSREGLFSPIRWIQVEGSLPTYGFTDANIIGYIKETSREIEKEASKVYWYGLGTREDTRIYTESLKFDEDGDFDGYPILRETYFPDEANVDDETTGTFQVVEQEYQDVGIRYGESKYIKAGYAQDFALEHADFTRILITKNHAIFDEYDPGLTRDITVFHNKKAQIRYWNPNVTSRQIYYMHINADVVYTKSKCTVSVEYVLNTKRIEEYDSSYLFTSAAADRLAKALASSYRLGRYTFKISSLTAVEEGTFVSIVTSNGLVATGLILERVYNDYTKIYDYSIRSYNTAYLAPSSRTVRISSLSGNDQGTIALLTEKAPIYNIAGVTNFGYYGGESTPINTSLIVSGVSVDPAYTARSFQWYSRSLVGLDVPISGATTGALTVNYNDPWYYTGVIVTLSVNNKYSFSTRIENNYLASFLGNWGDDPNPAVPGDWFFYTGATGGGRVTGTMYYWTGTEWLEDVNVTHNALAYSLTSSVSDLTLYSDHVYYPSSVTLNATYRKGLSQYNEYPGRFTVDATVSGVHYINLYTSASDEHEYASVPSGIVSSYRYRLYEAGGTSNLLKEVELNVRMSAATIESRTPYYWGALTSAPPIEDSAVNNYYFDANTPFMGGGYLRYYNGVVYTEMTTAHPYYATALKIAMTDMMVWATAQSVTLASANAVFGSIAAASAFIATLSTVIQYSAALCDDGVTHIATFDWNNAIITLRDALETKMMTLSSAAVQSYYGQGVQQRSVKLSEDGFEFLNSPSGGTETSIANVGRLGNGSNGVIMDGIYLVPVSGLWESPSLVSDVPALYVDSVQTVDGVIRCAYIKNSVGVGRNYIAERTLYNGVWSSQSFITDAGAYHPKYIQTPDGLQIFYTKSSNSFLCQRLFRNNVWGAEQVLEAKMTGWPSCCLDNQGRIHLIYCNYNPDTFSYTNIVRKIYSGGSWSAEEVVSATLGITTSAIQDNAGNIHVAYKRGDGYLVERKFTNSAWGGELVISTAGESGGYVVTPDGILRIAYRSTALGYPTELIYNGTSWVNSKILLSTDIGNVCYIQSASGDLYLFYNSGDNGYVYNMTLRRYAQLGAGIIESGSNANGSYIKFSDGTMEQWARVAGVTDGAGYTSKTWTYPLAYLDPPTCSVQTDSGASTGASSLFLGTVGSISAQGYSADTTSGVAFTWHFRAIGRWK
jgi:hypothetical protein